MKYQQEDIYTHTYIYIDVKKISKANVYAQGHLRGAGGRYMRKWIKLLAHLIAMIGYVPKSCNLFTSASLWRLRRIELLTSLRAAICNS